MTEDDLPREDDSLYSSSMTVLHEFVAFARALPAEGRDEMDLALAALLYSYDRRYDFTAGELAELHRRADESDPDYSNPQDIAEIFGKSVPG